MMDSKCVVCQSDILIPSDCNDDDKQNDENGLEASSTTIKCTKPGTSSSNGNSNEKEKEEEKETETEEALKSRTKIATTNSSSNNSYNCKVHSHTRMMRIFCKYFDLEFHKNNKQILFLLNNDDDDADADQTENENTEQQNRETIHWFCVECEDIMSEMYLLDKQLESIQSKIRNIMTNLTTKIIETDINISDNGSSSDGGSSSNSSSSNEQQQSEDNNCSNQNTVNNQNNHVQNINNEDSPSTSLPSPRNTKSIVNELIRKKIRKSREATGENYSPQLIFDGFRRSPSSMIKSKVENLPLNLSKDVNNKIDESDSEPIEDSTLEIEMYEGSPLLLPYPEIEIKERDEPFIMDFEDDVHISTINNQSQGEEEEAGNSEGHLNPPSSSNDYLLPRYSFNSEETDDNNMVSGVGENCEMDDDSYPGIFGIVEEFRRSQMAQEELQYSRQSAAAARLYNNHNHSSNSEENHNSSSGSSSFNRSQTGDSPSSNCNKRRNNFSSYMSKVRNLGNGILIYDKTMSFQEIPEGFKCRYRQCTAIEKTIHAMIGHLVSHQEEKANPNLSTSTENHNNSDSFTETLNSFSSKEIPTTPTTKVKPRAILKITPPGRKRSCEKKVSTPDSSFASPLPPPPFSSSSTTISSTSPSLSSPNSKETAEELLLRSSSGVNQSGLKKWKCEACDFNFDFSGDLYLHIVRSHGSKVETPANIVQMLGPEKEKEPPKEEEKKTKIKRQTKIKQTEVKEKPKEKEKLKENEKLKGNEKLKEKEKEKEQQLEKPKEEEKPKEAPKMKEPKLQCSRCGAKCRGVDALEVHLKRSLCRKKAQICPNCKEEFAQKWKLDIHLTTCAAPEGQEDEKSKKKKAKKIPNDNGDSDSSSSIDAL